MFTCMVLEKAEAERAHVDGNSHVLREEGRRTHPFSILGFGKHHSTCGTFGRNLGNRRGVLYLSDSRAGGDIANFDACFETAQSLVP